MDKIKKIVDSGYSIEISSDLNDRYLITLNRKVDNNTGVDNIEFSPSFILNNCIDEAHKYVNSKALSNNKTSKTIYSTYTNIEPKSKLIGYELERLFVSQYSKAEILQQLPLQSNLLMHKSMFSKEIIKTVGKISKYDVTHLLTTLSNILQEYALSDFKYRPIKRNIPDHILITEAYTLGDIGNEKGFTIKENTLAFVDDSESPESVRFIQDDRWTPLTSFNEKDILWITSNN